MIEFLWELGKERRTPAENTKLIEKLQTYLETIVLPRQIEIANMTLTHFNKADVKESDKNRLATLEANHAKNASFSDRLLELINESVDNQVKAQNAFVASVSKILQKNEPSEKNLLAELNAISVANPMHAARPPRKRQFKRTRKYRK
jgi:hypothetical protein